MQIYLIILSLFMLAEFGAAYRDKYAFAWQVRTLPVVPEKFLTFWGHAGMHSDFWVVNPVVAHILAKHAASWSLSNFSIIFAAAAFAGALVLIAILQDSLKVASAHAHKGLLRLAGAIHYLSYTITMSVAVAFYLLTDRANVDTREVVIITIALMTHWAISVLHPPKAVHGSIHLPAKIIAGAGWIVLIGFAVRLLRLV
jgi:hypothetical protein